MHFYSTRLLWHSLNITSWTVWNDFDEDIISFLTLEITKHALYTNNVDPLAAPQEIKVFTWILILSEYCVVPEKRRFWESNAGLRNELVYNAMRWGCFTQIMKFIHGSENNKTDKTDKFYKLRPLIDKRNEKFLSLSKNEQWINYDKPMFKFFGWHNCKQFIGGNRYVLDIKCGTSTHLMCILSISILIKGKKGLNSTHKVWKQIWKGYRTTYWSAGPFSDSIKSLPFCLYLEDLFLGMNLIKELQYRGYGESGTIGENRFPTDCLLSSSKEMEKRMLWSTFLPRRKYKYRPLGRQICSDCRF